MEKFLGSGGTLSIEVLGVDLLSIELPGRLLVDELTEPKPPIPNILLGLCLIFRRVEFLFTGGGLDGLSVSSTVWSNFAGMTAGGASMVVAIFDGSSLLPSPSICFPAFRLLGDGDLDDDEIHDFRANVANDSDTDFVLSLEALGICGTGGASSGIELAYSGAGCLSGDPFTF